MALTCGFRLGLWRSAIIARMTFRLLSLIFYQLFGWLGLLPALLHLARRCRWRVANRSRFPSRRLPEVLKATNPGIADGVPGLWWRTPV
jgi:hypothetical protein